VGAAQEASLKVVEADQQSPLLLDYVVNSPLILLPKKDLSLLINHRRQPTVGLPTTWRGSGSHGRTR
jgi:hypothetical protein